ncbi:MAG: hypothetical protein KC912_12975 [Proteobacteria bacterium]|nr:hypothetical protein [Pseudomonadota bacterium]
MNDEQTLVVPEEGEGSPPDVPFLFGIALWLPLFFVFVYFFVWFMRPRGPVQLDDVEPEP